MNVFCYILKLHNKHIGGNKINLRKIIYLSFALLLSISCFTGINAKKVLADSAPPVTEFYIMGYSWAAIYDNGQQGYYDASDAQTVPVPDIRLYIVTYQIGYGQLLSSYSMTAIDSFGLTDDNGIVVGFIKVTALNNNICEGLNTINMACNSYNMPWNTMRDSITLDIEPGLAAPSANLMNSNAAVSSDKTSELINTLKASPTKTISLAEFNAIEGTSK